MSKGKLHPSVQQFKQFVKNHPEMIQEVRQGKTSWQELYEEWYLLGEEDPKWDAYSSEKPKQAHETDNTDTTNTTEDSVTNQAFINNILNSLKKMDMNKVQYYMNNLHDALGAVQQLITQFQSNEGSNRENHAETSERRPHPFSFRKD
ncbi:YlbD family protein [Caldibacillus lycopersici]|uniref:YlbD family protein n=1 Tax=Perspicuibacillus lycopersici TaxID=1325689 RepID=A0AAE3IPW2_9BACI|nr:YlbD family protein [Perspicuibacillus lycopersici]MCU9612226.1 YlbD family protein [Perspicuibacillus lycopersici]